MAMLLSFLYNGTAASPIIQLDLLSPLLGSTWSSASNCAVKTQRESRIVTDCENPERMPTIRPRLASSPLGMG